MDNRVKFSDLKDGDVVFSDGEDHCLPRGYMTVFTGKSGLYVICTGGSHYLDGNIGPDGFLIGFTRDQPNKTPMVCEVKNLSVLAYAHGFTLWLYTTADTAAAVNAPGYFNSANDMVRVGDIMLANTDTSSINDSGMYVITANSGGVVDIANMLRSEGGRA